MKLNWLISILVFSTVLIGESFAQENLPAGELIISIENNFEVYKFTMELISPLCWDADPDEPDLHNISDEYDLAIDYDAVNAQFYLTGFWEPSNQSFGLGLYKVSIIKDQDLLKYFYIDYRTSDLIENFNAFPSLHGDIRLTYDISNNKLYYWNTQTEFPFFTRIWDEKYWIVPKSDHFPNFWGNCLALINNGNGNPKSVWGPHPADNINIIVTGYNIYRAITTGNPPPNPNYVLLATVDAETFEYNDTQVVLGSIVNLHYKITATYTDFAHGPIQETSPTNTVIVGGALYKSNPEKLYFDNFTLSQNYPNPFNPATIISFSVAENSFITLKVYDVLGNEITTLVSEEKAAGLYTVNFNASNLQSGIYFYEIRAKNFRDVKKLILLK